jgi:hypothetical protein
MQELATGPCAEPNESNSHFPAPFLQDPFQYYPPIYAYVFKVVSHSTTIAGQLAGPECVDFTPRIPAFNSVTPVTFVLTNLSLTAG